MKFIKKFSVFILLISLLTLMFGCSESTANNLHNTSNVNKTNSVMKVHYIDVGQGDSILLQVNGKNLLIDAGPNTAKDNLMSYLQKQNIKKLDYVIATHPHEDHIGCMDDVIYKYNIGQFLAPKKTTNTKTFENMTNALKKKNLKITTAKPGIKLDLGENTTAEILAPINDKYENINNYSVVLRVTHGKNSFLFTGDAEKLAEKELIDKNVNLKADVLKTGHHGSSSSSSKEFLDKVNPKIAVISCGKNNDYHHPHKETLTQFKNRNLKVYRTDVESTILLTSDGNTINKVS